MLFRRSGVAHFPRSSYTHTRAHKRCSDVQQNIFGKNMRNIDRWFTGWVLLPLIPLFPQILLMSSDYYDIAKFYTKFYLVGHLLAAKQIYHNLSFLHFATISSSFVNYTVWFLMREREQFQCSFIVQGFR